MTETNKRVELHDGYITGINSGQIIADCNTHFHEDQNKANAAFIAKSWNSHYELIEALEKISFLHIELDNANISRKQILSHMHGINAIVTETLKKAKGE